MLLATYKIRVAMIMKFQEIGMKYIFKLQCYKDTQEIKNAGTLDLITISYELIFLCFLSLFYMQGDNFCIAF